MTHFPLSAVAAGLALAIAAPTLAQTPATAPPPATAPQTVYGRDASIPFMDSVGARDWRADGDSAIYVQDQRRNWYHAELIGPCTGLRFATRVGFVTRGTNTLDRFASVVVDGQSCSFTNFVTSPAPPPRDQRAQAPQGDHQHHHADPTAH